MSSNVRDESPASVYQANYRRAAAVLVLALAGVGVTSPYALLSILLDGLPALIVVGSSVGTGFLLVPLFKLGPLPRRWTILIAAALGLGFMSLLVLLLGLAGLLQRPLWVVLVCLLTAFGAVRARALLAVDANAGDPAAPTAVNDRGATRYLWLLVTPFLALSLLAASNAPGFIWQEEGFGYDVLEYHLQLPKEYREAGRIAYLPHNVYANFPANVEMLYLLNMILQDGDVETGVSSNIIHLLMGLLAVYAAWVAGRQWSPRAGLVCGLVMAGAGWLGYLSGLAYVENGVLFFGTAAAALLFVPARSGAIARDKLASEGMPPAGGVPLAACPPVEVQSPTARRRLALSGVFAGLSCGCKYTAVPMIAIPLLISVPLLTNGPARAKAVNSLAFVAGLLAALSPWLIKNLAMTGNPVFPLANTLFEVSPPGWGPNQTEQWERGHTILPEQRSLPGRLIALWRHVPGDKYQRFGPVILVLGFLGLIGRRRDRLDFTLVVMTAVQLLIWLFGTHLFARFAVVLLIPLVLLAGRALGDSGDRNRARFVFVLVGLGALWNFVFSAGLIAGEHALGAPASLIYEGELPGYEFLEVVNEDLPPNARILLIGDARAFYFQRPVDYFVVFNENQFVEAARAADSDADIVAWLRMQGYKHVLVNWSEVRRLANTYGFAPEVTESLFNRLTGNGLTLRREFEPPRGSGRYITLYELQIE